MHVNVPFLLMHALNPPIEQHVNLLYKSYAVQKYNYFIVTYMSIKLVIHTPSCPHLIFPLTDFGKFEFVVWKKSGASLFKYFLME